MTKRESLKYSRKFLGKFSLGGFVGLIIAALSLIFSLPEGQTFMNLWTIDIQFIALITFILGTIVFLVWVVFFVRHIILELTTEPNVTITGKTLLNSPAEIKIENNEPVNLSNAYIKLVRFRWNKSVWNDLKSLTELKSNNFFSKGLTEVNRTISRSPIFVQIAKGIETKNITKILLDNHSAYMPLKEKNDISASYEYEFVFEITGKFDDDDTSSLLGKYYGKLYHEQIQAHERVAKQDIFKWKEFYKTSDKQEQKIKKKAEKELGFSFDISKV